MQKKKKEYEIFYYHLMLIFTILLISSATLFVLKPKFTGNIVAQGGNITRADITHNLRPDYWIGFYGNITDDISLASNFSFSGGEASFIYLHAENATNNSLLIIANTSSVDLDNISPATHIDINSFLNISALDPLASSNTFTLLRNFTINSVEYPLLTAITNSFSGEYLTGVMKQEDGLVFLTHYMENSKGFDNSAIDFQVILPVPPSGNITYFFWVGEESLGSGSGAMNCSTGFNVSSYLDANSSIVLDWNTFTGATGYTVQYIDDPAFGDINFTNPTEISVNTTTWTDSGFISSTRRYYKVLAKNGGSQCDPANLIGASNISLTVLPDSPYNLISFPYFFFNDSIEAVFSSIDGQYSRVYEFRNNDKQYNIYLAGLWDDINTIKKDYGYWINVDDNLSLRYTGQIFDYITHDVYTPYNLLGFPVVDGNATVDSVLSSISGEYSRVYEFRNHDKQYDIFLTGLWDDIHSIKPDVVYWVKTESNVTLNYTN